MKETYGHDASSLTGINFFHGNKNINSRDKHPGRSFIRRNSKNTLKDESWQYIDDFSALTLGGYFCLDIFFDLLHNPVIDIDFLKYIKTSDKTIYMATILVSKTQ